MAETEGVQTLEELKAEIDAEEKLEDVVTESDTKAKKVYRLGLMI